MHDQSLKRRETQHVLNTILVVHIQGTSVVSTIGGAAECEALRTLCTAALKRPLNKSFPSQFVLRQYVTLVNYESWVHSPSFEPYFQLGYYVKHFLFSLVSNQLNFETIY